MENPMFQVRKFWDGTYSVIARVWNPQKKFFEHPSLIGLPEEEAVDKCSELAKKPLSVEYVTKNWVYIGN